MITKQPKKALLCLVILWASLSAAYASEGTGQEDLISAVLVALIVILAAAKLGGELVERAGMPAVLGELLAGVILGNPVLFNPRWSFFEPLRIAPVEANWAVIISALAQLGVITLLFEVGLKSKVPGMMKVGASSLLVAVLGVTAPFLMGYGVSWFFIRQTPRELVAIVPAGFSLNYVQLE